MRPHGLKSFLSLIKGTGDLVVTRLEAFYHRMSMNERIFNVETKIQSLINKTNTRTIILKSCQKLAKGSKLPKGPKC